MYAMFLHVLVIYQVLCCYVVKRNLGSFFTSIFIPTYTTCIEAVRHTMNQVRKVLRKKELLQKTLKNLKIQNISQHINNSVCGPYTYSPLFLQVSNV